jgi:proline dehydrogenase
VLTVTGQPAVRKVFTETRPGRALATRFVAGETLDHAVDVTKAINARGATVSLDHLGEHVTSMVDAVMARDDYLACLDRIEVEGLQANISVKLTQLGLGMDDGLAVDSLRRLAERAAAAGTTVTVDMEESRHTAATIDVYEEVQSSHGNLGIAVQSYLYRTPADLDRVIPLGGHVRLCKGAYAEPPEVAHQAQEDVDRAFDALLHLLMGSPDVCPAIASHDHARLDLGRRLAAGRGDNYEYQMLYGVRPKLQDQMLAEGLPLRIYVPYGSAWYPYLTRRMAERPANLIFFLRAAARRS